MRNSLKAVYKMMQATQNDVPIEKQFVNELKRSIEISDKKDSKPPSQTYKPSSMQCMRNMYYQRVGAPKGGESTAVLIGICESGTDRHERVQAAVSRMRDNGFDCDYIDVSDYVTSRNLDYLEIVGKCGNETKLYDASLAMSFMCDGIIRYKNKYYILEIKTESNHKWLDRKGVADEHKRQAAAYSLAFGLDSVLFLYISRDMCDMKAFMYVVSQEEKDRVKSDIELCELYVNKGEVPPKDENVPRKACTYCAYKSLCQAEV